MITSILRTSYSSPSEKYSCLLYTSPADRRPYKSLFKIAANQLEEQVAPLHQVANEQSSGDSPRHLFRIILSFSITCNLHISLDMNVSLLLQFQFRSAEEYYRAPPGTGSGSSSRISRIRFGDAHEAGILRRSGSPLPAWPPAAYPYPPSSRLFHSRSCLCRVFFSIRFRGQLRPHGLESGQLQLRPQRSGRPSQPLSEFAKGDQPEERSACQP